MKDIFDEVEFGEFKLNSRIIRTGLWESQNRSSGNLKPEVFLRYERLAKSGVGLITSELISIYHNDRFSDYSHNINYPLFLKDFQLLTNNAHQFNVPVLAQIGFVNCNINGRQMINVNDLTLEDIRQIQADHIIACKKLSFAGFDGIQLNMGNTYFLAKVINPFENKRKDDYGGNTLNRLRMVLEMIKVIKTNTDLHINCKINIYPKDQDDTFKIAELLQEYGADSLQVTKPASPQFFKKDSNNKNDLFDFTDKLASELDIPVILGGGLDNMDDINNLINSTNIDFVSMQRPFVQNPTFLEKWKKDGFGESECLTCNNCYWKKTSTCHIQKE